MRIYYQSIVEFKTYRYFFNFHKEIDSDDEREFEEDIEMEEVVIENKMEE